MEEKKDLGVADKNPPLPSAVADRSVAEDGNQGLQAANALPHWPNYVPFGDEWRAYMMRHTKAEIVQIAQNIAHESGARGLALTAITLGIARIEKSGRLEEFCFNGIRYSMNGSWTHLMQLIERPLRAAIAKAEAR